MVFSRFEPGFRFISDFFRGKFRSGTCSGEKSFRVPEEVPLGFRASSDSPFRANLRGRTDFERKAFLGVETLFRAFFVRSPFFRESFRPFRDASGLRATRIATPTGAPGQAPRVSPEPRATLPRYLQ
jgi:hypothetical protein